MDYLRYSMKERVNLLGMRWLTLIGHNPAPSQMGKLLMRSPSGTGILMGCLIPAPSRPCWPCWSCDHATHATHITPTMPPMPLPPIPPVLVLSSPLSWIRANEQTCNSLAVCLMLVLFRFNVDFACWPFSFSNIWVFQMEYLLISWTVTLAGKSCTSCSTWCVH